MKKVIAFVTLLSVTGLACAATCADSDTSCFAQQNFGAASIYCKNDVARLADTEWKWADGAGEGSFFHKSIFSRVKNVPVSPGVITYLGDSAMMQDPKSGAFRRVIYSCDFDYKKPQAVRVKLISYGRLE